MIYPFEFIYLKNIFIDTITFRDNSMDKSALTFTKTQRGRLMLIYNGYKYVENRQSNRNIFWR